MTIDYRERPKRTLAERNVLLSPPEKKLNEDRLILSAAKCRPVIAVFRNMRFMRVFTRVPLGGGVNYQTTISVHACIRYCEHKTHVYYLFIVASRIYSESIG